MFARVAFRIVRPTLTRDAIRIEPTPRFYLNSDKILKIHIFETSAELSKELYGNYKGDCEFPIYTVEDWILDGEDAKRLLMKGRN